MPQRSFITRFTLLRFALLCMCLGVSLAVQLSAQIYRPERWQDGRPLRQGKFLLGAGWNIGGFGFTPDLAEIAATPPKIPSLGSPAVGAYSIGGFVGVASNLDLGLEIGGTRGGWAYNFSAKYAFLPYTSPFQVALLLGIGLCPVEIRFGENEFDNTVDSLFIRPSTPLQSYYIRSNLTTYDLSIPLSIDTSPELTWLLAPRVAFGDYFAGVGTEGTAPNGLSTVSLTQTSTSAWFYGFTVGAKVVRESPQWWQYLLPVPFLASGAMQMSFTWARGSFYEVSLSYQHLFPSFGTLLTTVTQEEMNNIEQDRRQKDSILAAQKEQIELGRTRLGRALSAEIVSVKGTDERGNTIDNPTLRVEEFEAETSVALLPYIFFEHNSFVLPSRYRRIRAADRASFTIEHFARLRPTDMYRNILNILGKRLQDASTATLTLTGTTSGLGEEAGNTALAERRARAVQDYLVDVWKISPQRFTVQTRVKSDTAGIGGEVADTRRVEITASEPSICADLTTQDAMPLVTPERLTFGFDIAAGAGLKQWNLELTQLEGTEVKTLKLEAGTDANINKYIWNINETRASVPLSGENVVARLEITDLTNRVAESALALVPVDYISLPQKRRTARTDTKITALQRWVFGFEQENTTPDAASIQAVQRAFAPKAGIILRSRLRSQEQFDALEKALRANLSGAISLEPLSLSHSLRNDVGSGVFAPSLSLLTSEDRFYARAVSIEIRTPVVAKQ